MRAFSRRACRSAFAAALAAVALPLTAAAKGQLPRRALQQNVAAGPTNTAFCAPCKTPDCSDLTNPALEQAYRQAGAASPIGPPKAGLINRVNFCCRKQGQSSGLVELPAGMLDVAGEPPLETARRELREEAELEAEQWEPLLTLRPSPGIIDEIQHVFVARGLRQADRGDFELRHEEADLEVVWVPLEDLVDGVLAGELTDGPLVAAVLAEHALRSRR